MPTTHATSQKRTRILSFGLLFAGLLFLCNPNLNLFDILPDAIGYFCLTLALSGASEIFPHFDTASRGFRILFWINLAKIPAIFLMLRVVGINMDERAMITIFAFAFAVVEWIFAVPAFRALFAGLIYLGEREGISSALSVRGNEKGRDSLELLTLIFLFVKGAATFLPEIVFLSTFFYNGSLDPRAVNPVVFYPVLAGFAIFIVLIFGLVWLVSFRPYLKGMKEDPMMTALLDTKADVLAPALSASADRRRKKLFFFLLSAGFLFAADLWIENCDVLWDAVAAIAFFAAFALSDSVRYKKTGKIFSLLYLGAAILRTVLSSLFFAKFTYPDIAHYDAALIRYIFLLAAFVLEAVFFVCTVGFVIAVLREFILANTGKSLRPQDTVLRNEVHTALFKRCKRLSVLSFIYAALRPLSSYLLTLTERHIITEDEANQFYSAGQAIDSSRFAWFWIVVLVVGIAFAVYAITLHRAIKIEANLATEDE